MPSKPGDRSAHFPAIERKHGKPVAHWLNELKGLGSAKYPEQIAFLREQHGFSQAHANALVMYARGSTTTRRFSSAEEYFHDLGGDKEEIARAIFAAIMKKYPQLELVVAWNQPMLKSGKHYVFGLSAATNHLLMASFASDAIDALGDKLSGLEVNKKTIKVPTDWKVDSRLLHELVRLRLAEIH